MARYLSEKQSITWAFSTNRSKLENVKISLTRLACFRQATLDRATLDSFAQILVLEDLRAFQVAMAMLSETKREQGETAFPDLASILEVIKKVEERWDRDPRSDPAADRDPVYVLDADSKPPKLKGDRLRLAVDAEIAICEKELFEANRTARMSWEERLDTMPEPRRSRYRALKKLAADYSGYAPTKALSGGTSKTGGPDAEV